MASEQELALGAIVNLTQTEEGQYTATQSNLTVGQPPNEIGARHSIDWSFGPIKVTGYVDTDTFEIGVAVSVVGISLGNIYGNLKDGVGVNIDLFVAKGSIRFYLKNGNEVWIHLDVKITFDGSFEGDYKIITI